MRNRNVRIDVSYTALLRLKLLTFNGANSLRIRVHIDAAVANRFRRVIEQYEVLYDLILIFFLF